MTELSGRRTLCFYSDLQRWARHLWLAIERGRAIDMSEEGGTAIIHGPAGNCV